MRAGTVPMELCNTATAFYPVAMTSTRPRRSLLERLRRSGWLATLTLAVMVLQLVFVTTCAAHAFDHRASGHPETVVSALAQTGGHAVDEGISKAVKHGVASCLDCQYDHPAAVLPPESDAVTGPLPMANVPNDCALSPSAPPRRELRPPIV